MSEKQVTRWEQNFDTDQPEAMFRDPSGPWVRWDDYAALAAERDAYKRAKAENDERFQIERDQARADAAALAARVERLEGALRAYGRHLANCNYKTIGCSCGLDAALEEPT